MSTVPGEAVHPIQVVARRTGLSMDVIRAWERRYAAVSPQRTATRRRLYSEADIRRLTLLREAVSNGRRIGDVAPLGCEDIARMLEADGGGPPRFASQVEDAAASCAKSVAAATEAILALDAKRLAETLDRAAVANAIPVLLEQVIAPLLRHVGELWRSGSLRVCHEHLASSSVRRFLFGLEDRARGTAGNAPVLVLTTPVGQPHEFGVLMASVVATTAGWTPVCLGAENPVEEIAYAALTTHARAIGLGLTWPGDDARLVDDLYRLRSLLPDGIALLAGGAAVPSYATVLDDIGARRVERLEHLNTTLDEMRSAPPPAPGRR